MSWNVLSSTLWQLECTFLCEIGSRFDNIRIRFSPADRLPLLEWSIISGERNDGLCTRVGIENTSCKSESPRSIPEAPSQNSMQRSRHVSSKRDLNHSQLWESSILPCQAFSSHHPLTVGADIAGCSGANMALVLDKLWPTGTSNNLTPLGQSIPPHQTPPGHAFPCILTIHLPPTSCQGDVIIVTEPNIWISTNLNKNISPAWYSKMCNVQIAICKLHYYFPALNKNNVLK